MVNYFENCKELDTIKKRYRELAKQYHPDLAGENTTSIMQDINKQYANILNKNNYNFSNFSKDHDFMSDSERKIWNDLKEKLIKDHPEISEMINFMFTPEFFNGITKFVDLLYKKTQNKYGKNKSETQRRT
ncbi:MAG: J domain-containing protein [Parachlamydiales bacterium]|jgi:DnaJ-class molecular chaperone